MAQYLQDILKDYDDEFGLDSKMDQFSSASPQHTTTPQISNKSPYNSSFARQQPMTERTTPRDSSLGSAKYQFDNSQQRTLDSFHQTSENSFQEEEIPRFRYQQQQQQQQQQLQQQQQQQRQQQQPQQNIETPKINKISVEQATQIINDLKKERIKDAQKMQQLQTENARLVAKMTILEHTDLKVAELGSRVEQLLQKYLEAEQIRTQQAAQISQLRQEVIVLKSRLSSGNMQGPPKQTRAANNYNDVSNF